VSLVGFLLVAFAGMTGSHYASTLCLDPSAPLALLAGRLVATVRPMRWRAGFRRARRLTMGAALLLFAGALDDPRLKLNRILARRDHTLSRARVDRAEHSARPIAASEPGTLYEATGSCR